MKTTLPQQSLLPEFLCHAIRHTHRNRQASNQQCDGRASQLAAIAASGDEDNAACAAADLFREFPPLP